MSESERVNQHHGAMEATQQTERARQLAIQDEGSDMLTNQHSREKRG